MSEGRCTFGKPFAHVMRRRLYHGTSEDAKQCIINEGFKLDRAGKVNGCAWGKGVYLTEDYEEAEGFSREGCVVIAKLDDDARVVEVDTRYGRDEDDVPAWVEAYVNDLPEESREHFKDYGPYNKWVRGVSSEIAAYLQEGSVVWSAPPLDKWFARKGCDAIKLTDSKHWVVFNPTAIDTQTVCSTQRRRVEVPA